MTFCCRLTLSKSSLPTLRSLAYANACLPFKICNPYPSIPMLALRVRNSEALISIGIPPMISMIFSNARKSTTTYCSKSMSKFSFIVRITSEAPPKAYAAFRRLSRRPGIGKYISRINEVNFSLPRLLSTVAIIIESERPLLSS